VTGEENWNLPARMNRKAAQDGRRYRLFCASQADVFEDFDGHVVNHKDRPMILTGKRSPWWEPLEGGGGPALGLDVMRARLWELVEATPNIDWLLLTKRPENVMRMVPEHWRNAFPKNVWMGVTVGTQKTVARLDILETIPAWVRWVSSEPLLSHIDLELPRRAGRIHWIIGGGESGDAGVQVRPTHPWWAASLRDQCVAAGVRYHFKQWGEYMPVENEFDNKTSPAELDRLIILDRQGRMGSVDAIDDPRPMLRVGKKSAGRLIDGVLWDEFPDSPLAEVRGEAAGAVSLGV
jgi:hypothetical protein